VLPAEVVLGAGLDVGVEVDRERARRIRRELKRHEAALAAARSLRHRDLSEAELAERLARARVAPASRTETVSRLAEAGIVDDTRLARQRAATLADRGAGDELIRYDLATRGIAPEAVELALHDLDPERERAERIVARRGPGVRTARYLARKGFPEDVVEIACAEGIAEDAPPAVR